MTNALANNTLDSRDSQTERPSDNVRSRTCPNHFRPQLRTYPHKFSRTYKEWTFYPDGYHYGKRSLTPITGCDLTLSMAMGTKRKVWSSRGNLPQVSPGDKTYQVPEYSPSFHKVGSTLPVICFGGSNTKTVPDTFVPLQELPGSPKPMWRTLAKAQMRKEEIFLVKALDKWKPALPLSATLN